jgi:hypothetical protein
MGKTPTDLLVDPGPVNFELQLDGYNNAIVRTNITNKGNVIVSVILLEGQGRVAIRSETVETITNSVGMIFVKVRDDLWVGKSKVTNREYEKITPSGDAGLAGNRQLAQASWTDAMTFCSQLATIELGLGKLPPHLTYSLPKPEEWTEIVRTRGLARAPVGQEAGLDPPDAAREWCFTPDGRLLKPAPTIVPVKSPITKP